jgi:hypothetical protein
MRIVRFAAMIVIGAVLAAVIAIADDANPLVAGRDSDQRAQQRAFMRSWERSLIPLVASQSLDAASSYGYRELNPLLPESNGVFGMRATAVKFSVVGALIGAEYLLARKSPRAARLITRLNWASSAVTTGLVVHNYVVR